MSTGILSEIYQRTYDKPVVRQKAFEVWCDLFAYAKNLKGNWMISQDVFNNCIATTAIESPEYFAECVEEMVKTSGVKIKYRSHFVKSIKFLKTLHNKTIDRQLIIKALTDLLNSGLTEPLYAERAIRFTRLATAT